MNADQIKRTFCSKNNFYSVFLVLLLAFLGVVQIANEIKEREKLLDIDKKEGAVRNKRAATPAKSTTDIPEEKEVGEDVTTDIYGRLPSSPAHDPIEQHDGMTTLMPKKKTNQSPANNHVAKTSPSGGSQIAKPPIQSKPEQEAEEIIGPGNTGKCGGFSHETKGYDVVITVNGCQLLISPEESMVNFGEPGKMAPTLYVRRA